MNSLMLDLEDYYMHKIDSLKQYYKFGKTSDLIEYLLDEKYSQLPQECTKCGSREFRIKDEFLGA